MAMSRFESRDDFVIGRFQSRDDYAIGLFRSRDGYTLVALYNRLKCLTVHCSCGLVAFTYVFPVLTGSG